MPDSLHRCAWCGTDPLYVAYHDEEWGVPEYDARALWEKLVLDGFQAGLAWITILRKREGMRDAFDGFDPEKVAAYGEADIERLLGDARIIRSRAKINSAIKGARIWLEMRDNGEDFSEWLWSFTGGAPIQNEWPDSGARPVAQLSRRARAGGTRWRSGSGSVASTQASAASSVRNVWTG